MKNLFLLIVALAFVVGCTPTEEIQRVEGKHFGETINESKAITYDQLLAKFNKKDKFDDIKIEGKVSSVCQAKGCWMTIVSDDSNKEPMFVKFKDYGFFMPKDLSGQTVVMRGNAYKEVTSVDELRHYAEDEGLSKEEIAKITEPKTELKFMADGVVIKK